jgi:hypothetical protein
MSHRTQITLTNEQYETVLAESKRSGLSIAELTRRALDRSYGTARQREVRQALLDSFGAWSDRDESGEEYVERLRPGMEHRLSRP